MTRPVICGFSSHEQQHEPGYGAWELIGRLSYLDYCDVSAPPNSQGQPVGTFLPQATIGVNWYLADRLRVLFNYTSSVPDVAGAGASDAHLFGMRLGMFW